MDDFFQFVNYVLTGINEAMKLNPRVFAMVSEYAWAGWVILVIAILGGASLLLGQSAILFVNRVTPGRFALSLVLNGVVFTIGLLIWAVAIWVIGALLFVEQPKLGVVLRMVALGAAPYVYGFLVLIPYLGDFIGKVLSAWSLVVVLAGIAFLYQVGFWPALLCVGTGWMLVNLLTALVGKPVIALRDMLFRRITGSTLDARVQDILLGLLDEQPTTPPSGSKAT